MVWSVLVDRRFFAYGDKNDLYLHLDSNLLLMAINSLNKFYNQRTRKRENAKTEILQITAKAFAD